MRIFYAIYFPEGDLRTCVDGIRLIARPTTRHPAHITVRGPYSNYQAVEAFDRLLSGTYVDVNGVGTFFGPGQNTVYMRCDGNSLRAAWHKPDYGYRPHITVYDGESRGFAESLLGIMSAHPVRFRFRVRGLEPLVSGNGVTDSPLRRQFDGPALGRFLGEPISLAEIDRASSAQRLEWIDRLCNYLNENRKVAVPL